MTKFATRDDDAGFDLPNIACVWDAAAPFFFVRFLVGRRRFIQGEEI